jgi:hypothetical protein
MYPDAHAADPEATRCTSSQNPLVWDPRNHHKSKASLWNTQANHVVENALPIDPISQNSFLDPLNLPSDGVLSLTMTTVMFVVSA